MSSLRDDVNRLGLGASAKMFDAQLVNELQDGFMGLLSNADPVGSAVWMTLHKVHILSHCILLPRKCVLDFVAGYELRVFLALALN